VGVKLCGHEQRFAMAHRNFFESCFEEAGAATDDDLWEAFAEERIGKHDCRTDHFFTYAFSCAMYDTCRARGVNADLLAGYSFGIYAALYASGALSFTDGLAAVGRAFDLMDTVSRGRDYTMAITLGLTAGEIDAILSRHYYDQLCMVNSNNDTCKVFAGPRASLRRFIEEALRHEAIDARLLEVSIPYHHPRLLHGISGGFREFLSKLHWQSPLRPIISTIDQGLLTSIDELLDFTARNLCTPINWERVAAALNARQIGRVIECGAGISLTQNARFMPFQLEYVNVKNADRKLNLR